MYKGVGPLRALVPTGWHLAQVPEIDLVGQGIDTALLVRMGIALAMGALIGLERERHRESRTVLAGIRTYPLVALAGVLFATLGTRLDATAYIATGAAVFGLFAGLLYWVRHTLGIHGITSPIALFVTYLVGALIGLGFLLEGVIAGVATAVLLFTRAHLHRLAEVMTEDEMAGALQFIIVAFVLFPLAAGRPVDPWGVVNPRQVLLVVIFVAGISFVSFLAMRIMGSARGLQVSGLLGGLVNSEAATMGLAQLVSHKPKLLHRAVAAITLTNATMLLRNLLIAAFVDPSLAFMGLMVPAIAGMVLVQGGYAYRAHHTADRAAEETGGGEDERIRLRNPFAIRPALRFGALFVLLQLIAFGLAHLPGAGQAGIVLTAIGGLVSSAAVVASVGTLAATGQVNIMLAAATAVLATVVSTLNKLIITRAAERTLYRPVQWSMLLPTAVGLVILAATVWAIRGGT